MILSPMRFKNFVWPHNPRVYSIAFERKLAVHKIPFGRYRVQSLGQTRRVLRGQGEFAGERAYETFCGNTDLNFPLLFVVTLDTWFDFRRPKE